MTHILKFTLVLCVLITGLIPIQGYTQILKFKKSGLFSSLRYFQYVMNDKNIDKKKILNGLNVEDLTTTLGDKEISFRIAYNSLDPKKETIIAHIGLNGSVDDGNVLYLADLAQKKLQNYNFIVIDTLSSQYLSKKECLITLGGIEDIKLVDRAIEHVTANTALKEAQSSRFILMGGSGSSFTLFHAASYLNRKYKQDSDVVKGIFILSGYDGLHNYLKFIQDIENFDNDKKIKKKYKLKSRFMGKQLLKTRLKFYNKELVPNCDRFNRVKKLKHFEYVQLLEDDFTSMKEDLNEIYQFTYPDKDFKGFTSLLDYHETIAISNHLDDIKLPVLFFHAKNDPLSTHKEMEKQLFSKIENHQYIKAIVTDHGGHASFAWVYGEDWFFNKVHDFLNSIKN